MERYKQETHNKEIFHYNAGVLGIDIELCNALHIKNKCLAIGEKFPVLSFADQDLINLLNIEMKGNLIKKIDATWNVINAMKVNAPNIYNSYTKEELNNATEKSTIRHFAGKKPRNEVDRANDDNAYTTRRDLLPEPLQEPITPTSKFQKLASTVFFDVQDALQNIFPDPEDYFKIGEFMRNISKIYNSIGKK